MYRKLLGAAALTFSASVLAAPEPFMEVSFYSQNDPFIQSYAATLKDLSVSTGTQLTVNYAQEDLLREYQQIELAVKNGAGAIIYNPVDPASVHQVIALADSKNLPLIFINRQPAGNKLASYANSWYVGTDSTQAGAYQSEILTRYCLDHPEADRDGDGEISYYLLQGQEGLADTVFRTMSLNNSLKNSPVTFRIAGSSFADWQSDKAISQLDSYVRRNGLDDIEAVVANNDDMALGALQFLKSKGYNSGDPEKFIPIVGIDATPRALDAIKAKEMIGTVKNDYVAQARAAFRLAYLAMEGKEINNSTTGYYLVDGNTVYIPYVKIYFE